ncbi:hypothetical protein R3X26_04825 [Vibrio sp. TH_r3]|uniref:hypothetical protein n=1 Tax=Vibrio sp. TH_r3 TaxID=3082084 RepID=UPI002953812F|nr:hypothetical protein [Vibrio sp. TH_r3]MDV7103729.1 hypothetical protein [Vibrio sp. TH_r3]
MDKSGLENEWSLLQHQFDNYEKYSLLIKLFSVFIFCGFYLSSNMTLMTIAILCILWIQDAIWKTFQSRIEPRLLELEQAIKNIEPEKSDCLAFQFNSQYLVSRPSQFGLVKEYICQSLRPTIAYPHALLVVLALISTICSGTLS